VTRPPPFPGERPVVVTDASLGFVRSWRLEGLTFSLVPGALNVITGTTGPSKTSLLKPIALPTASGSVGAEAGISYSADAEPGQNLASFALYSVVTSTLTWDTVRAVTPRRAGRPAASEDVEPEASRPVSHPHSLTLRRAIFRPMR